MAKKVHAVGVIFEDHEGRILVLRRHAEDPEGGKWGLPGDKIESDETAVSAAVRETEEEIGHQVDSTQLKFLKTELHPRADLMMGLYPILQEQYQSVEGSRRS